MRRKRYAIAYDIADDRNRNKVAKTLEGYGKRVQYSVFECELAPAELARLKKELAPHVDEETDSVRFYLIHGKPETLEGRLNTPSPQGWIV